MRLDFQDEIESSSITLVAHLEKIITCLRDLQPEHWDWTPNPSAPTARVLAIHTWQWLCCDRQHILEPDFDKHIDVPEAPESTDEICAQLAEEAEHWKQLLSTLTPDKMLEPRQQFGMPHNEMNVRTFYAHMVQNVIYKSGQLSMIYFALGYDGTDPYDAPFPNAIYAQARLAREELASKN